MVDSPILLVLSMLEIGNFLMASRWNMEKGPSSSKNHHWAQLVKNSTKGSGKKILCVAQEYTTIVMEQFIRASGRIINSAVKEYTSFLMVPYIKDSGKGILWTGQDFSLIIQVGNGLDSLKKESSKASIKRS